MLLKRFKPMFFIVLVSFLGFFMLSVFYSSTDYLIAGAIFSLLSIFVYLIIYNFAFGDIYIFLTASMLSVIGLIMLYRLDTDYGSRQFLWYMVGIGGYFSAIFLFSKIRIWDRLFLLYVAVSLALFAATLIFGVEEYGSKNWIRLGGFSIQPSEIIKVFFCLAVACIFSKIPKTGKKDKRQRVLGMPIDELVLCAFVYICMGILVLFQNELGTAMLLFLIYFSMCFIYKTNGRIKLLNILCIALGIFLIYLLCKMGRFPHIERRIISWLDPESDKLGAGYNVIQSLTAITSGGYFGSGLCMGMPDIVPMVKTDFIFAAICEEMGIFMGIAIILLYFILVYRGIKTVIKCENEFLKAACMALVLCLGYQTFIIVGGVTKLIPLTGITLPFVSYGGSSMLTCFAMLGIITAVSFVDKKRGK